MTGQGFSMRVMNEALLQDNLQNRHISTPPGHGDSCRDIEGDVKMAHSDAGPDQRKVCLLRAKANVLSAQLKFQEAAKSLDEISAIQSQPDLDTALLMADCYLLLGREAKGLKAIEEIERTLLASAPCCSVDEVIDLANDFIEASSFIRAIVLLRVAADMHQKFSTSESGKLDGVYNCMNKIQSAVTAMIQAGDRLRVIAADFGVEYMHHMLEALRSVRNVHAEKKVVIEAWCTCGVGYIHGLLGENEKGLKVRRDGVDALDRHFGATNAERYRVYGILQHNIGVHLYNLGRYAEAEKYYSKAMQAKKNALDYDSENNRTEDVARSEKDHLSAVQKIP